MESTTRQDDGQPSE
jgi:hypothetical protein